jgi:hypothetical protein
LGAIDARVVGDFFHCFTERRKNASHSTAVWGWTSRRWIERAKQVLEAGVGTTDGGACLAPDFEFCAAVVGPLGRDEYLGALGNFKVRRGPDRLIHALQPS